MTSMSHGPEVDVFVLLTAERVKSPARFSEAFSKGDSLTIVKAAADNGARMRSSTLTPALILFMKRRTAGCFPPGS